MRTAVCRAWFLGLLLGWLLAPLACADDFGEGPLRAWSIAQRRAVKPAAANRANYLEGETVEPGDASNGEEVIPTPDAPYEGPIAGEDFDPAAGEMLWEEDGGFFEELAGEPDYNPWYGEAGVTFLSRQRPRAVPFTQVDTVIVIGNTPFLVTLVEQSGKSLRFDFEPGLRMTLGRELFVDILNRQHSIEFSSLAFFRWGTASEKVGQRLTNGIFTFGSLMSPVEAGGTNVGGGLLVGGFNGADYHRVTNTSDLNNFELNYRLRRRPGRDRMIAAADGTWTRECNPGCTPSILGGLRYVSINEISEYSSRGVLTDFLQQDFPFSAEYHTVTHNHLIGAQLGGDLTARDCNWMLSASCKAGLYANAADATSDIIASNNGAIPMSNAYRRITGVNAAFVGDLGLEARYRVAGSLWARASYDFMWVQGLALAPEQQQAQLTTPTRLNTGGHTLFQGVSLGAEYRW